MELQYYGANCLRITTKKVSLVVDDMLAELGAKKVIKPTDVALQTTFQKAPPEGVTSVINYPGEYEISGVSIWGIAARSHMDEENKKSAVMYKIIADDVQIAVLGHVYPELSNEQLEQLGMVDVLIVPVGGHGYTLDPVGALKLVKKIEPKIIIPTHYEDSGLSYPVAQLSLEAALKELAMEPTETVEKLKLKRDMLPPIMQLYVVKSVR